MTRQISPGYGLASPAMLEDRIFVLEARVAALSDALRVLTASLAGTPLDEPGDDSVGKAARRAHELLLSDRA